MSRPERRRGRGAAGLSELARLLSERDLAVLDLICRTPLPHHPAGASASPSTTTPPPESGCPYLSPGAAAVGRAGVCWNGRSGASAACRPARRPRSGCSPRPASGCATCATALGAVGRVREPGERFVRHYLAIADTHLALHRSRPGQAAGAADGADRAGLLAQLHRPGRQRRSAQARPVRRHRQRRVRGSLVHRGRPGHRKHPDPASSSAGSTRPTAAAAPSKPTAACSRWCCGSCRTSCAPPSCARPLASARDLDIAAVPHHHARAAHRRHHRRRSSERAAAADHRRRRPPASCGGCRTPAWTWC